MSFLTQRYIISLCFIFYLFAFPFHLSYAEWVTVKYVVDGDTVVLSNNQHVRLLGVDTPEIKSKYHPRTEYYAKEAKKFLNRLLRGKKVWLESEKAQPPFDKYGRRLAYIFTQENLFVNRELIRQGYAEAIRFFPYKYKKDFIALEKKAKMRGIGMWKKYR